MKTTYRSRLIVACDPGKSGGFALIDGAADSPVAEVWKCPQDLPSLRVFTRKLRGLIRYRNPVILIEKVNSYASDSRPACFVFGGWYFAAQYTLLELKLEEELQFVTPREWQKPLDLYGIKPPTDMTKNKAKTWKKNQHKARAAELYPQTKTTHATADALLIAHHGLTRP